MKPVTSYTRRNLIPGEQILYASKLHGFCYVWPMALILFGIFLLLLPMIISHVGEMEQVKEVTQSQDLQRVQAEVEQKFQMVTSYIPDSAKKFLEDANEVRQFVLGAIFVCFGLIYLFATFLKKISTEHCITNKKIIFKKGFIQVDESEVSLSNIEGVKVHQTVLDRMIGRGRVLVNGVGMEQLELKNISRPNEFRHNAYTAVDQFARGHHQGNHPQHDPNQPPPQINSPYPPPEGGMPPQQ